MRRISRPATTRSLFALGLLVLMLVMAALPAPAQTADGTDDTTITTLEPPADEPEPTTIPAPPDTAAPVPEQPAPPPEPEAEATVPEVEEAPAPEASEDSYGDLWVILRDEDGVPILDANGCVQPYDPDGNLLALDAECALPEGLVAQEVDFGRLNVGRSPTDVLNRQYVEVLASLVAGQPLHLDEAGRLGLSDGVTVIDSPLGNLSIHRQLALGLDLEGVTMPDPGSFYDRYDTMAATLGAAADKGGLLTVDLIVYNNEILGIPAGTTLPVINRSGGTYVDYRGFTYDRAATFPGCLRYEVDELSGYRSGTLMDVVFGGEQYTGSNVAAFAQAADDARRVIEVTHTIFANVSYVDRVYESGRFGDCPPGPSPTMFTDVTTDYWAADGIVWLGDNEYASGYYDGTFRPTEPITRGAVAYWLYNIAGRPDVSSLPPLNAEDVPAWMEPAVRWMVGNRYATLTPDGYFYPYRTINRGTLSRMLFRIAGSPAGSPPNTFIDVPPRFDVPVSWISDPAHDPVYATGFANNTFRPLNLVTRATAAMWMYRIYELSTTT